MFCRIINHIKIALQVKKTLMKIQINKNEMNLIRILIQLNYINYIYKPTLNCKKKFNNFYYISINTNNALNNIKNLYRPSSLRTISYKELLKNKNKKKNLIILSTSKGLITSNSAINYKIGGVLVTNLFF